MPRHSPDRIDLTAEQRRILESRARQCTLPYWQVVRAQMVLLAAQGLRNDEVAERLGCRREVVSQWRNASTRRASRASRTGRGGGKPPTFPPGVRAEVTALACELPAERGVPLSRWSSAELAREAVERGITERISGATVWRWLSEDAIRPWNYRSWIFPRDPDFRRPAARILDLYAGRWEGRLLHPGDFVVCADEKPSIQARARKHPTLPAWAGEGQKVEHEHERRGALCYFAAWDARRAKLFDCCAPERLLAFGRRYHRIAEPFEWKFTRHDLDRLLAKLDAPQQQPTLAA